MRLGLTGNSCDSPELSEQLTNYDLIVEDGIRSLFPVISWRLEGVGDWSLQCSEIVPTARGTAGDCRTSLTGERVGPLAVTISTGLIT